MFLVVAYYAFFIFVAFFFIVFVFGCFKNKNKTLKVTMVTTDLLAKILAIPTC